MAFGSASGIFLNSQYTVRAIAIFYLNPFFGACYFDIDTFMTN